MVRVLSAWRAKMLTKNCTMASISTGTRVVVRSSLLLTMEAMAVLMKE